MNTCKYKDKEGQVMKTKVNNVYLVGGLALCSMSHIDDTRDTDMILV